MGWLAHVLCLASALLCVVYSWRNLNRGDESVHDEDVRWTREEDKLQDRL